VAGLPDGTVEMIVVDTAAMGNKKTPDRPLLAGLLMSS
jgi:hypothetical protein